MPTRVNHRTLVRTLLAVVVVAGGGAAHSQTEAPQWGPQAHMGAGGSGAMPMMAPMGVPGMSPMPMVAPMGVPGMGPMPMMAPMGVPGMGPMPMMAPMGVPGMGPMPMMAPTGMAGMGPMPMMAPMGVPGMGPMPMMAPTGMAGMGPMPMWGPMGMGAMHAMHHPGAHHMAMHGDDDEHGDRDMPHHGDYHHRRGKGLMRALRMLDLTAEQQGEVRRIRHDLQKRRWELEGPMIDARARLRELYTVDEWDVTAIGEAYGALFDLRRQRIEASLEAYNRALALLTEEQRDQLRQWRERHGGRAKGEHEASRPRYGAGYRMHHYGPGSMHGHGGGMVPRQGGTAPTQP